MKKIFSRGWKENGYNKAERQLQQMEHDPALWPVPIARSGRVERYLPRRDAMLITPANDIRMLYDSTEESRTCF